LAACLMAARGLGLPDDRCCFQSRRDHEAFSLHVLACLFAFANLSFCCDSYGFAWLAR